MNRAQFLQAVRAVDSDMGWYLTEHGALRQWSTLRCPIEAVADRDGWERAGAVLGLSGVDVMVISQAADGTGYASVRTALLQATGLQEP